MVNVADELSEQDVLLEMEDGLIGFVRKRLVNKFHQGSRSEQKKDQHHGHTAEAPGKCKFQGLFRKRTWMNVQNQVVEYKPFALLFSLRIDRITEDRISNTTKEAIMILRHFPLRHSLLL